MIIHRRGLLGGLLAVGGLLALPAIVRPQNIMKVKQFRVDCTSLEPFAEPLLAKTTVTVAAADFTPWQRSDWKIAKILRDGDFVVLEKIHLSIPGEQIKLLGRAVEVKTRWQTGRESVSLRVV